MIVIHDTVQLPVKLDETVSRGTIVVPANHSDTANLVVTGAVTVDIVRGDA